ncbi:substrate-binding periplasmic protein [Woeseia oceani]|uniref:Solute-binding protein family 3/N-terminal domain-containing protein n=1 Tax=Woeseia oceani TaxID=1548547 RepID=A0A193LEQ4_9GAMM|nr:transporter substrate-binding domain-containing protein [Woeseia oceani]ANO51010.1 hypothetical protein BA177_07125 [Woeseia oceani]
MRASTATNVAWTVSAARAQAALVALLLVTTLMLAACTPPIEGAARDCHWRVAWDPYEPYSYSAGSDLPLGFDIDVVTEVAARVGCTVSFEEMAWGKILEALESGAADVTVGTGYKNDRAAWSWYSESYRKEVIGLLVRSGTVADFPGTTVDEVLASGLVFGKTVDDMYAAPLESAFARYPAQIKDRVTEAENLQRLLEQSIDGFLIEVNVAAALIARLDAANAVEFHRMKFDAGTYRLQMSKKTVTPERLADVNAALQALAQSGWLERGIEAYGIQGLVKE